MLAQVQNYKRVIRIKFKSLTKINKIVLNILIPIAYYSDSKISL